MDVDPRRFVGASRQNERGRAKGEVEWASHQRLQVASSRTDRKRAASSSRPGHGVLTGGHGDGRRYRREVASTVLVESYPSTVDLQSSTPHASVVLRGRLANPAPEFVAALRAYRKLTWTPIIEHDHSTTVKASRTVRLLTADEVDALVSAYEAGAIIAQLSSQFGITAQTVSRRLQARGVLRPHHWSTPEEAERVFELNRSGRNTWLSPADDLQHPDRAGVPRRDPHGRERTP